MSDPLEPPPFPQLYFCCDERRRDAVRGSALNGIDYLEVVDHDADLLQELTGHGPPFDGDRQRFLRVHFVNDLAPASLGKSNLHISGGERIRPIVILDATIGTAPDADVLTIEVEEPGDFSIYTLTIVSGPDNPAAPDGIDPRLALVEFSFKVECPSDFDCAPRHVCPPEPREQPEINYLAKDYGSFRKLLLDRMALLLPDWRERNPADLGITLVELLAYVGDQLSYQQDAIATEAYLGSARKRVSLRRHARLVDYFVHDGTSARVWVQLTTEANNVIVPPKTQILSRLDRVDVRLAPGSTALVEALRQRPVIFETLHEAELFAELDTISFYTWGDRECCLPTGATRATLVGPLANLQVGAVLIFEEQYGAHSGLAEDADRTRRHAVRLTSVQPLVDPLPNPPAQIVNIEWRAEDALPFPFCLSGFTDEDHGAKFQDDISIARGNIVLADHGMTIEGESLGVVEESPIELPPTPGADRCDAPVARIFVAAVFGPPSRRAR